MVECIRASELDAESTPTRYILRLQDEENLATNFL